MDFIRNNTWVAGGIGVLIVLGALVWNGFGWKGFPQPKDFTADLRNQIVAVPDDSKPGQLLAWYFTPGDDLTTKLLDQRAEDYKRVYYLQVTSKAKDGQVLSGIMEAHYVNISGTPYVIALVNINLQISIPATSSAPNPTPPPVVQPNPTPPGLQPAQPPPGIQRPPGTVIRKRTPAAVAA